MLLCLFKPKPKPAYAMPLYEDTPKRRVRKRQRPSRLEVQRNGSRWAVWELVEGEHPIRVSGWLLTEGQAERSLRARLGRKAARGQHS